MSAKLYLARNGPVGSTAALPKVTTGTAIKTMMQLLNSTDDMRVVEWGISFDGSAAATPIQCELITTSTVASTGTAMVAADITLFSSPAAVAPSTMTYSTTGCSYTATAEGTVTTLRTGDIQQVAPTNQYVKQFPLSREFEVAATNVLRIRVTATVAVNAYCYVIFEI